MKNIIKTILLVCFSLLFIDEAEAQKRKKKGKKVEPEKKSNVIVFGNEDSDDEDNIKSKSYKINIKTNPFSFILGSQSIEVEKEFTDVISLQVGIGATFSSVIDPDNEILQELYPSDYGNYEDSNKWGNFDIYDDYSINRTNRLGGIFSFSPRFFYEGDGFEGGYIAPAFTYKRFNVDAFGILPEKVDVFIDKNKIEKEYYTYKDLSVRMGGQQVFDSNVTSEYFLGLGIRFVNNHRQDLGYLPTGEVSSIFTDTTNKRFLLEAGIRIGYSF
jgi:hypothetical protein